MINFPNLTSTFFLLSVCIACPYRTAAETHHISSLERALDLSAPQPKKIESPSRNTSRAKSKNQADTRTNRTQDLGSSPKPSEQITQIQENDSPVAEKPSNQWDGPGAELGYSYFGLSTKRDTGTVHAFDLGGYFTGIGPIRFGGYFEFGYRDNKEVKDDYLVRINGSFGYKHIWHLGRFVPFANVVGGVGLAIGSAKKKFNLGDDSSSEVKFNIPTLETFWTIGPEVGLDVRLAGRLWAGLSFCYQKITMKSFTSNAYIVRARFGF